MKSSLAVFTREGPCRTKCTLLLGAQPHMTSNYERWKVKCVSYNKLTITVKRWLGVCHLTSTWSICIWKKKILSSPKDIFLLLLEGEEGSEEGRKKSQSREKDWLVVSCTCLDWEWNPQPFSYKTTLQPTESLWPGRSNCMFMRNSVISFLAYEYFETSLQVPRGIEFKNIYKRYAIWKLISHQWFSSSRWNLYSFHKYLLSRAYISGPGPDGVPSSLVCLYLDNSY